jgi:hypothetical protein
MKTSRIRLVLLGATAVALAAALGLSETPSQDGGAVVAAAARPARPREARAESGEGESLLALAPRAFIPSDGLFRAPQPATPKRSAAVAALVARRAQALAEPPPRPPAVPFRYLGAVFREGRATALLRIQDRDIVVQTGEVIEGGAYRVKDIAPTALQVTYLPLSEVQAVPLYEPQAVNLSEAR